MADNQRIDDLRRRVQKDPASIAFAQLAEELRRAGEFEESVQTCRTGLAIHPGYLSARVTLGRALIELNQLEDARSELELVLKSAPENLAALRGLGEIHHRSGDLASALAQYRAALALARNDPDLEETVAQLVRQVEPSEAPADVEDPTSFDAVAETAETAAVAEPAPMPAVAEAATTPAVADLEMPDAEPEQVELAPSSEEPVPSEAELEHTARTLAALEQWLDAIHVARADRRA